METGPTRKSPVHLYFETGILKVIPVFCSAQLYCAQWQNKKKYAHF